MPDKTYVLHSGCVFYTMRWVEEVVAEVVAEMLVAVPLRNQLYEPTTDGRPDEDAHKNCVAATEA